MLAAAFWVQGDDPHVTTVVDEGQLSKLLDDAKSVGTTRWDVAAESKAAAIIVRSGSEHLVVELHASDRRYILRRGRGRQTGCWVSGRSGILPSDAAWTVAQASRAAMAWVQDEPVRVEGAHVQEVLGAGDADARTSHRDRIFGLVEQYRHLHGRHLVSDVDLHAFLLGAVGIAGATRLPLTDVVERSAPMGDRSGDAYLFARTVDTAHERAHHIPDAGCRRDWLAAQLKMAANAVAIDDEYRSALERKLFAYLECELGRKRVATR